jgi:hypothetical protein
MYHTDINNVFRIIVWGWQDRGWIGMKVKISAKWARANQWQLVFFSGTRRGGMPFRLAKFFGSKYFIFLLGNATINTSRSGEAGFT